MAIVPDGTIYVADQGNYVIRRISPNGNTTTFAGQTKSGYINALGANALFNSPVAISFDGQSDFIVLNISNYVIRKISSAGSVTPYLGRPTLPLASGFVDGQGSSALFLGLVGITLFYETKEMFITETQNQAIRQISPNGTVHTISSTRGYVDGPSLKAKFSGPSGMLFDPKGEIIVVDHNNQVVRKISRDSVVSTISHKDRIPDKSSIFSSPVDILCVEDDCYILSDIYSHVIRKLFPNGTVSIFVGSSHPSGFADGFGTSAKFYWPSGLAKDSAGFIYVTESSNHAIRKISPTGNITTLAGNGTAGFVDGLGREARFQTPRSIVVDNSSEIFVADTGNSAIRKFLRNGTVVTIVGFNGPGYVDGPLKQAKLDRPTSITLNKNNEIIFTEYFNKAVRKIDQFGNLVTIIGPNSRVPNSIPPFIFRYWNPRNLIADDNGNLYVNSAIDLVWKFNCSSNSSSNDSSSTITQATPDAGLFSGEDGNQCRSVTRQFFPQRLLHIEVSKPLRRIK
jgi:hypothetical protein